MFSSCQEEYAGGRCVSSHMREWRRSVKEDLHFFSQAGVSMFFSQEGRSRYSGIRSAY